MTAEDAIEQRKSTVAEPAGNGPDGNLVVRILRAPSASVIAATVLLVLAIGLLRPRYLLASQLLDVLQASTYVALIAAGMAFLISMREIDLSVGSTFGLCLISAAMLISAGVNGWLAALGAIVLGGLLGGVNATIVTYIRIPAIVATLATLSVYRGLAIGLTDGTQVAGLPIEDSFFTVVGGKVLGVPFSVIGMSGPGSPRSTSTSSSRRCRWSPCWRATRPHSAPHMRRGDLTRARKVNDRMRSALADFDPIRFSALNREFHFVIYDRCPNTHVRSLLEVQWSRLDTIRRSVFAFVPGRAKSSVAEHAEILDLIAGGAPADRLERAARSHKLHTADAVHRARLS